MIKLDATDSTNSYLKNAMLSEVLDDFTIVVAQAQLEGRGQRGASWQSEPGKNLTFSMLKKFHGLDAREQFSLNIRSSLAVLNTLRMFHIPDLRVKWPNDILSGPLKICGILIENMMTRSVISASVIGIGLNINQVEFNGLPQATSMKLLLGRTLPPEEVLQALLANLREAFAGPREPGDIRRDYEERMFRKDIPSTFRDQRGRSFTGIIRGISGEGKLRLELDNGVFREYAHKEVRLVY